MNNTADQLADLSDDAVLVLYVNGDAQAAGVLTFRLAPRLLSYTTRILRDLAEAEDVVQDAMMRLWQMAPDWQQGEAKLSSWLFKVVSNLCTDRLRKRRGVGLDEIAEPIDEAPGAAARMMQAERLSALDTALGTLPDRQRQAVVLRHIEGLTNPEIADILDVTVEAVESLTARGKRALAASLAPKREEIGL